MVEKLNIYCDESCQNAHHYMVIGVIVVDPSHLNEIVPVLESVKTKPKAAKGELKWSKVSIYGLPTYTDFIDQFDEFRKQGKLQYHCIVVDCQKIDYKKYHSGDSEIGFSKFIYQLLLKQCRLYTDHIFYCYLDDRTTHHSPESLRVVLNNGANKKHNKRPYKIVEFKDSSKSILIQLTDVITGAIAYRKNEKDKRTDSNAKKAKDALSAHIANKVSLANLCDCTPIKHKDFTIWNIMLGK